MADEQLIGVARLRLEAEIRDFEVGMRKAREELSRGEASFAQFTEKGEKKGARLLASEEALNREIQRLTMSSTAFQLAEIDRRAEMKIARARKAGTDEAKIAEFEVAIHRQKHRLLIAEEKARTAAAVAETARRRDARRAEAGEDIRGSNVFLDTSRASRAEMRLAGEVAGQSRAQFNTTRQSVLNLSGALGAQAGAAGKAAGALSNLMMVGLNPVAIATAALAVTIGLVVQKHQEQAERVKAATAAYAEQRAEVQRWQAAIEAARAGKSDADERALSKEIATKETQQRLLQQQIDNQLRSGDAYKITFENVVTLSDMERRRAEAAIRDLGTEIEELYRKRHALAGNREEQERAAAVEAAAVREREFQELAARGREAHRRQMEREDAEVEARQREELFRHNKRVAAAKQENAEWDRKIQEAWERQNEALRDQVRLTEDLMDLRIETARLALRDGEGDSAARLKLLGLEEKRALARVEQHYKELRAVAKEGGRDLEALEEQIQAHRTAIVRDFARERVQIEAEALGKIAQLQVEAAGSYSTRQARAIANDLYNAGFKMNDIAERLRGMGIDPEAIGFGRAFVPGPAAVPSRGWGANTDPWAGAWIDPGGTPAWMLPAPKITVINTSPHVGVAVKPLPGGSAQIVVAEEIINGGEITRALEERYPWLRGGAA